MSLSCQNLKISRSKWASVGGVEWGLGVDGGGGAKGGEPTNWLRFMWVWRLDGGDSNGDRRCDLDRQCRIVVEWGISWRW